MAQSKQRILVGWAVADITPDRPAVLAGQFYGRTSTSVHDPVTATAMVVTSTDGSQQAVWVSVDAVGVKDYTVTQALEAIAAACPDVSGEAVSFNATHTHSAPTQYPSPYPIPEEAIGDKAYSDFMAERIAGAVKAAWDARRPAKIGWGLAHAAFPHNRISIYDDGRAQMYGPTDTEDFRGFQTGEETAVQLLFTWDADDVLTGIVVNVACPSQCSEHSMFITADYWSDVRQELRRRHGEHLFILPQCAAAGDISPHLRRHRGAEARMLTLRGLLPADADRETFEMARRPEIARKIADAVDEALPAVRTDAREQVEFAHRRRVLDLPVRMVTDAERDNALKQIDKHRKEMDQLSGDPEGNAYKAARGQIGRHQRVVDRYASQADNPTLPMVMHTIRLGDVAITTNRFELYHDYEVRIQGRSPAIQTFVVQLAGEGGGSYLPTARAVAGASYGSGIESNFVGPEGGDVLVEETLRTIGELFA